MASEKQITSSSTESHPIASSSTSIDVFIPIKLHSTVPFRLCPMSLKNAEEHAKGAYVFDKTGREAVLYVEQEGNTLKYVLAGDLDGLYSTDPNTVRSGVIPQLARLTGIEGELTLEQLRSHLPIIGRLIDVISPPSRFFFHLPTVDELLEVNDRLLAARKLGTLCSTADREQYTDLCTPFDSLWARSVPTLEPMVGDDLNLTADFWERSLAAIDHQLFEQANIPGRPERKVYASRNFADVERTLDTLTGAGAYYALRVRIDPALLATESSVRPDETVARTYLPAGSIIESTALIAAQRINPRFPDRNTKINGTKVMVSSAWPLAAPYLDERARACSFSEEFLEERERYLAAAKPHIPPAPVPSSSHNDPLPFSPAPQTSSKPVASVTTASPASSLNGRLAQMTQSRPSPSTSRPPSAPFSFARFFGFFMPQGCYPSSELAETLMPSTPRDRGPKQ